MDINKYYTENKEDEKYENPKNINLLKSLTKDSFIELKQNLNNNFCVFNSFNDILYLIFTNKKKSIISYDIINGKLINEIKNAHNNLIISLIYYKDKTNKRDLILSISEKKSNIKLWNINNFECLIIIKNIYKDCQKLSSCFLNNKDNIYIVTCKYNYSGEIMEPIKVYDFNGKKTKTINYSKDSCFYLVSYFDEKLLKNYIITCNKGYIKSYDFKENKIYHKYCDKKDVLHLKAIIDSKETIIKIIESCNKGSIRIWNFHSGELLKVIKIDNNWLYGLCLWNSDYLFIGCEDNTIQLIELKKGIIVKKLNAHNNIVFTIKKIKHQRYGEFLLTQGQFIDGIKLWENIN